MFENVYSVNRTSEGFTGIELGWLGAVTSCSCDVTMRFQTTRGDSFLHLIFCFLKCISKF